MPTEVLEREVPQAELKETPVTLAGAEALQAHFDMPPATDMPDLEKVSPEDDEKYGLSLSAMRAVGRIAVSGAENIEESGEALQLRAEFESCVFEGLSTDEELGKRLQVTKFDTQEVADGHVLSLNGTPMEQLVEQGYEAAKKTAAEDSRMLTQVHRDNNDKGVISKINSMVRGKTDFNSFIVISSDPKEAIKRDGAAYWYRRGYVKDMIYVQMYHWTGDQLSKGVLSFRTEDLGKLRNSLVERGVEVPEDVVADDLINYSFSFNATNPEEAENEALAIRDQCSDLPVDENTDTVGIVEGQQSIDMAFREMYLPISKSLALREKTERIGQVVSTFRANSQYFDDEVRQHLATMQDSEYFSDDDARLLHQLSVYAAIEKVRAELEGTTDLVEGLQIKNPYSEVEYSEDIFHEQEVEGFIASMGGYVQLGSSMGRSYSSCGGALQVSAKLKEFDFGWGMNIPQDIFARYAQEKKESEEDEFGPLNFSCTEGHPNRRKRGELKLQCGTKPCGGKVAC